MSNIKALESTANAALVAYATKIPGELEIVQPTVNRVVGRLMGVTNQQAARIQKPFLEKQINIAEKTFIVQLITSVAYLVIVSLAYKGFIPMKPFMITMLSIQGFFLLVTLATQSVLNNEAKREARLFEGVTVLELKTQFLTEAPETPQKEDESFETLCRTTIAYQKAQLMEQIFRSQLKQTGAGARFGTFFAGVALPAMFLLLTYYGHISMKVYMGINHAGCAMILLGAACIGNTAKKLVKIQTDANQSMALYGVTYESAMKTAAQQMVQGFLGQR